MRAPILTALLLTAATLSACGGGGDKSGGAPAQAQVSDAEKQKVLASLPAPYNTADLANGQSKFAMCRSCHTIAEGGANTTGPNLHGVVGHHASQHGDFKYSEALANSGLIWDPPTLDKWLESPRTLVPGTKMAFAGLKDPKDRIDLIGYLRVEGGEAAHH